MRFGMHLSFKGGPERAEALGCKALQIFCGNPRGWQKSPLDPAFVSEFRAQVAQADLVPLVVHATYLINLAAPDENIYRLSRDSFIFEMQCAAQLGAQFYVAHSGNHRGAGPDEGRRRVAACVQAALEAVPDGPDILMENTAGSGSALGATFEEIAALMTVVNTPRLALCLDTCHAWAAGYNIRTPEGVKNMLDTIEQTVGLQRLRCLHLSDAKGGLGSRLDRHEHIGKGCIGDAGFRALFSDQRLWQLPVILETPRDRPDDERNDLQCAINLAIACGAPPGNNENAAHIAVFP
ncbi:MAG: deoxyribonuclease IV [Planctomycetota bacterium]